MKKIVLLGYMGSGKSTIGLLLSNKMNLKFIDLDDFISKNEKLSISEIFDLKGETYFRIIEKKYLEKALKNKETYIISLGGGTPMIEGVFEMLNKYAISIYLKSTPEFLVKRLKPEKAKRPILSKLDDTLLNEFIKIHLNERIEYYEKADYTILTDFKKTEDIVEEIVLKLIN